MTYQTVEEMEQEPAGEVVLFGEGLKEISWRKGKLPDVGTKLYARPVPAQSVPGTQAALDVLAERRRQIEAEGWTPEYDDKHSAGEMAKAAACYALVSAGFNPDAMINVWPWHRLWWRPRDKRRNLVKAAALILAEIERLDRVAAPKPEAKP